jgi:hypothetical protein
MLDRRSRPHQWTTVNGGGWCGLCGGVEDVNVTAAPRTVRYDDVDDEHDNIGVMM